MRLAHLYRSTLKSEDLAFNVYVCRPLAAVVVYVLRDTRVAPNQVTFFALFVAMAAAACFLFLPWPLGLWLGVVVYELSYIFDKVDGMLARARGVQSPTGHLLDFLMDEIKAFFILAAVATGAYRSLGDVELLFWGLAGVVFLASGIGMTTFQRRPEVLEGLRAAAATRTGTLAGVAGGSAAGPGGRRRRAVFPRLRLPGAARCPELCRSRSAWGGFSSTTPRTSGSPQCSGTRACTCTRTWW